MELEHKKNLISGEDGEREIYRHAKISNLSAEFYLSNELVFDNYLALMNLMELTKNTFLSLILNIVTNGPDVDMLKKQLKEIHNRLMVVSDSYEVEANKRKH